MTDRTTTNARYVHPDGPRWVDLQSPFGVIKPDVVGAVQSHINAAYQVLDPPQMPVNSAAHVIRFNNATVERIETNPREYVQVPNRTLGRAARWNPASMRILTAVCAADIEYRPPVHDGLLVALGMDSIHTNTVILPPGDRHEPVRSILERVRDARRQVAQLGKFLLIGAAVDIRNRAFTRVLSSLVESRLGMPLIGVEQHGLRAADLNRLRELHYTLLERENPDAKWPYLVATNTTRYTRQERAAIPLINFMSGIQTSFHRIAPPGNYGKLQEGMSIDDLMGSIRWYDRPQGGYPLLEEASTGLDSRCFCPVHDGQYAFPHAADGSQVNPMGRVHEIWAFAEEAAHLENQRSRTEWFPGYIESRPFLHTALQRLRVVA